VIQLYPDFAQSLVIICPWCGDVWCRVSGRDTSHWQHRYVPCLDHPQAAHAYGCSIHGSIVEAETELLDYLPAALLTKEFNLYLDVLDV